MDHSETVDANDDAPTTGVSQFSARLKLLIGDRSVRSFARDVSLATFHPRRFARDVSSAGDPYVVNPEVNLLVQKIWSDFSPGDVSPALFSPWATHM